MLDLVEVGDPRPRWARCRGARHRGRRPRCTSTPAGSRSARRRADSTARSRPRSGRACSAVSSTGCCARLAAATSSCGRARRHPTTTRASGRSARPRSSSATASRPAHVLGVVDESRRLRAPRARRRPGRDGTRRLDRAPRAATPSDDRVAVVGGADIALDPARGRCAGRGRSTAAARAPCRSSPASARSTSCTRSRAGAPRRSRAASARARRCCCNRSRNGATPTSSSTSVAENAATRWPTCSMTSRDSTTRRPGGRCPSARC